MLGGIDAGVCLRDSSLGIDNKSVARGELYYAEVGERSVLAGDLGVGGGEQLEIQALLGAELFVRIHTVEAHSKNYGVALGVLRLISLEVVSLASAAWGLILGIKVKDHPLATIVLQADRGTIL